MLIIHLEADKQKGKAAPKPDRFRECLVFESVGFKGKAEMNRLHLKNAPCNERLFTTGIEESVLPIGRLS